MAWQAALGISIALLATAPSMALAGEKPEDAIRLTSSHEDVAQCKFISQERVTSHWGGYAMSGFAYSQALGKIKKAAIKLGGTHVLLVNLANGMSATNIIGDIYRCEAPPSS